VPSRKYVHIVAGLSQRSNRPWRSRRTAARGCWKLAPIDRFSPPVTGELIRWKRNDRIREARSDQERKHQMV